MYVSTDLGKVEYQNHRGCKATFSCNVMQMQSSQKKKERGKKKKRNMLVAASNFVIFNNSFIHSSHNLLERTSKQAKVPGIPQLHHQTCFVFFSFVSTWSPPPIHPPSPPSPPVSSPTPPNHADTPATTSPPPPSPDLCQTSSRNST